MFPAAEVCIEKHGCVTGAKRDACRPYVMTLVVMTDKHFVARYTNCKRKHAEIFFVESDLFKTHVEEHKPSTVHMFMKNHPCHHSGGNALRYPNGYLFDGKLDPRSCASRICEFYHDYLQPHGMKLHIHVSWLYKAFWANATRPDDKVTVQKSIEGLHMLLQQGIDVGSLQPYHWMQLANLCSDTIYLHHLFLKDRRTADQFVQAFIETQKNTCLKSQG